MSEEKEESMVWAWAVVIGGLLLVLCCFLNTCAGDGRPEGLRGTLSADWHHIGCMFSLCDQDGRCPVWSSKFSKWSGRRKSTPGATLPGMNEKSARLLP